MEHAHCGVTILILCLYVKVVQAQPFGLTYVAGRLVRLQSRPRPAGRHVARGDGTEDGAYLPPHVSCVYPPAAQSRLDV
jgi:hypothetical protein